MIGVIEFCVKFVICMFILFLTFFTLCAALAPFRLFYEATEKKDWHKAKVWAQYICVEAVLFGVIWFLF